MMIRVQRRRPRPRRSGRADRCPGGAPRTRAEGGLRDRRRPRRAAREAAGRRPRAGQPRHGAEARRGGRRARHRSRLSRGMGHHGGAGCGGRRRGDRPGHRRGARRRPCGLVARLGAPRPGRAGRCGRRWTRDRVRAAGDRGSPRRLRGVPHHHAARLRERVRRVLAGDRSGLRGTARRGAAGRHTAGGAPHRRVRAGSGGGASGPAPRTARGRGDPPHRALLEE